MLHIVSISHAYLIVNVEILVERVATGSSSLVVRYKDGVIEEASITSIGQQGRRGHGERISQRQDSQEALQGSESTPVEAKDDEA